MTLRLASLFLARENWAPVEQLNYHHLRYFWAVARADSLASAAEELCLTPQTISTQIKDLERALGQQLFARSGRRLVLTDRGQVVYRYADEIFSIGKELLESFDGRSTGRSPRLVVGVADVLPNLVAHRLIEPATRMDPPVHLICRATGLPTLLADLAVHRVDVVLSDAPIPPSVKIRAYNHLLGECGVTFMAATQMARRYRPRFPESLNGAPVLLPTKDTALRGQLDQWFESEGLHPQLMGEFEDSALLKTFGQQGTGLFPVPELIADEVGRQYLSKPIGNIPGVKESFYAISVERKVKHPAVVAICETARSTLF